MCVHCCRLFNFLQSIFHLQSCGEVSHERGNDDRGRLVETIAAVYQHPVRLDHSLSILNYWETRVHGGEDRPATPCQRLQDKVGGQLERGGGEGVLEKIYWGISNLCFYISLAHFEFFSLLCWQECRQGPGTCWLGSLTSTAHVLYRDHGSPFDNRLDVKLMSWVKMTISLMSNWCLE